MSSWIFHEKPKRLPPAIKGVGRREKGKEDEDEAKVWITTSDPEFYTTNLATTTKMYLNNDDLRPRESTLRNSTWRPMSKLAPMPTPSSPLSRPRPLRQPLRMLPLLLLLPVSTHRPSPKLKLRPKLRLRLRLLLNNKLELVLLLKLLLALMPLLALTHNILRNKNSTEVSPLMYSHKEPALNALLVRPPRCNTPVRWPPTVRYSILPFQEDSQSLSRSET